MNNNILIFGVGEISFPPNEISVINSPYQNLNNPIPTGGGSKIPITPQMPSILRKSKKF